MPSIRHFLLFLAAVWLAGTGVAADRNLVVAASKAQPARESRIALVIGNADYPNAPLANPVSDARAIAVQLESLRFRVTRLENATQDQMYAAIRQFGDALRDGGVGLFYYAGHALQVRGRNYLLPVRAMIEREDEIVYRTVDVGAVLDKMESARNRVNIVILDACRNNPFGREFRTVATGLAVMDAPVNTLIAFATAPGAVASDGPGRNGLYTQHLLASLGTPGLRLEDVFKKVRAGVRQDSAGRQVPWENTSLEVDFYFDPLPHQVAATPPAAPDPLTLELAFWESIKASTDAEDFRAYLKRYPGGQFAELAANRLRSLAPPPAPVAPAPPAPTPPAEPPTAAAPTRPTPAPPLEAAVVAPAPAPGAPAPAAPPPAPADETSPRLLRALLGHTGDVTAIAVAGNGQFALTASTDQSLRQWDLASGRELRRMMGHAGAVTAAAVSADQRYFLSGGSDSSVRLWSALTGAEIVRMSGHGAAVSGVAFEVTARYAASAAKDGEVILWELPRGAAVRRTKAHEGGVRSVAFSPEGRYLLTTGEDGSVRLWDVGALKAVRAFGPVPAPAALAVFVEEGRKVAAVDARGDAWVWEAHNGELARRFGTGGKPPALASVAADGRTLLTAGADHRMSLWELGSGRALWRTDKREQRVTALGLGPAGTLGLSATDDKRVLLWSAER